MKKVFEIILCMYLKTISPDRTRFRFVCSIYNWPISPKNIGQAILVGKFCHCRIKHVQRNLKIVMHVIYNWLLNKHICIIILEKLFVYQIKSTCNKIKLIQSCYSYWVSSVCIYYRSNYLHRNTYLIEVMELRKSYVYENKYTYLKILSTCINFADHSFYIVWVDCNGFWIYLLFVLKLNVF
jgi:hypothetical protein